MSENGKSRVLILGGCGFIGRNLTAYLIKNNLVSYIRVIDKVPPEVAWLNKTHQEVFANPLVEFKSANLINTVSCESAFSTDDSWDFVINCAGETKSNQTDPVYREGILKLSLNAATQAANHKVPHYIEISSGNMYSSEKEPHKETGPIDPWTMVAKYKYQVESELKNIPNLNYTVLRPGCVYGLGDRQGLTPRILIGAIYKYLSETMKLLWSGSLKLNTVHVEDLCRAVWFVCNRDDTIGKVFNVVDDGETTQGSVTGIIADIFGIDYYYLGSIMSKIAKSDMGSVVEEVNDKHLIPWAEACKQDEVDNTPLTPYMSEEALYDRHLYLDGTRLRDLGFKYTHQMVTKQALQDIVDDYTEMKVFPKSLIL